MSRTTQDLAKGQEQVIQALLDSISTKDPSTVGASESGSGGKITPQHAQAISNKIDSLLGSTSGGNQILRNEKEQPLNEEGLPIIEITEPIHNEDARSPVPYTPIEPIGTQLSEGEREARRREMNRILDLLEAEEKEEEERTRSKEQEDLEQRRHQEQRNIERLKAQREMQKKMGKALIQNLTIAREKEEQAKHAEEESWKAGEEARLKAQAAGASSGRKPRKTVSWAELPKGHSGESKDRIMSPSETKPSHIQGDVSLGRLSTASSTMKTAVVERAPPSNMPDSDDESEPELSNSDEENPPPPSEGDDTEDTLSGDESEDDTDYKPDFDVLEDDMDFDTAQHQREIALQYYEKRGTVGAQIFKQMSSDQVEGENEWDQPEVPLDATLAHDAPKPSVSRFKAGRVARTRAAESGAAASSLGGSNVSIRAQSSAVRKALRTGRLENGKLVGPADDSASDDEEAQARDFIGMVHRGELTNLGPDPSSIPAALGDPGPSTSGSGSTGKAASTAIQSVKERTTYPRLASLSQDAGISPSPLATPVISAERSSPKMESGSIPNPVSARVLERTSQSRGTPIAVPSRNPKPPERTASSASVVVEYPVQKDVMPSMIVDSPSFPRPGQEQSALQAPTPQPKKASRFMQSRQ